jgi:pimeloyl-ACP methyl ester carboxylesterase
VLNLPQTKRGVPDYRNWRYLDGRGYPTKHAMAYTVETEPGVQAIVYLLTSEAWNSRPPRSGARAVLYVSHLSSDVELREEPLIREVIEAEPESPIYTCDVRGIGESLPDTCDPGSFHSTYGNDYFYAIHSLMLGRPYLGQKAFDVLRVLDWMESLGHTEIHLVGRGWGALAGTFAAVMSPLVKQVTLKNSLTAYAEVAEIANYDWPLSALLPNVISHFDLPDCYAELEAKQLRQIDPWGPVTPTNVKDQH